MPNGLFDVCIFIHYRIAKYFDCVWVMLKWQMIIVDAMQFAFQHKEGATLCFITGDVDYAYLLATLQRPQWRTIVVSRGTMQSMLHVNCDMKIRWETDILQPIYDSNRASVSKDSDEIEERKNLKLSGNKRKRIDPKIFRRITFKVLYTGLLMIL